MKVLLLRPPNFFCKGLEAASCGFSLGIAYIAAVLKKSGYEVVIYDPLDAIPESIREKIIEEDPDVIGISNQFTPQFEDAKLVAEIAKTVNKDFLIVVGGSHPSSCPLDFFRKTDCVDIVVIGEGEYTMLEILERVSKGRSWEDIKGIVFKRDSEVVTNPKRPPIEDLDKLPYPAYELFDMENYFRLTNVSLGRPAFFYPGSERAMSFITSRGCPYDCIFCSIHSVMGNAWRCHNPEYIIGHIKYLIKRYNINHIHFEDDNFTLNINRIKKILNVILKDNLKITWDTPKWRTGRFSRR